LYAQDDWKITRKLTINYGLRYELWSPIGEQHSRQSNFNIDDLTLEIPTGPNQNAPLPPNFNMQYTLNGIIYPADFPNVKVCRGCVSQYLIPWDKHDFGPRLGFAYNIREKTVIRAAYGIFYGGEEQQGGNPNRGESAPFNESPRLNRPAGVSQFAPDPYFANGAPTGGITVGYPLTVFTTYSPMGADEPRRRAFLAKLQGLPSAIPQGRHAGPRRPLVSDYYQGTAAKESTRSGDPHRNRRFKRRHAVSPGAG